MKIKFFLLLALLFPAVGSALEGVLVSGQVGHIALGGNAAAAYSNALAFGAGVSLRTNPVLELALGTQYSAHAGAGNGLTLWAHSLSADFLVGHFNDVEFFLGGGPGFYQFNGATEDVRFGIHAGVFGDLNMNDSVRVGLGWRYHGIFDPQVGQGSYWTVMARVGFYFGFEQ